MCVNCKHYNTDRTAKKLTCAAFPDGIPTAILTNLADHRREYKGDHGIRYEPIDPTFPLSLAKA